MDLYPTAKHLTFQQYLLIVSVKTVICGWIPVMLLLGAGWMCAMMEYGALYVMRCGLILMHR